MNPHSARSRHNELLRPPHAFYELPHDFGSSRQLQGLCHEMSTPSDVSVSPPPSADSCEPRALQPLSHRLYNDTLRTMLSGPQGEGTWRLRSHPGPSKGSPGRDDFGVSRKPPPARPQGALSAVLAELEASSAEPAASAQVAAACRLADHMEATLCQPGQEIFEALRPLHDDARGVAEEVAMALAALRGLERVQPCLGEQIDSLAVVLPTRLSFYWLVAWGLVPAAQAKEVLLWAPLSAHAPLRLLMQAVQTAVLSAPQAAHQPPLAGAPAAALCADEPHSPVLIEMALFGRVRWSPGRLSACIPPPTPGPLQSGDMFLRRDFFRQVGRSADVVLFGESPDLARMAAEDCRDDCLFILQNAGHNPIVLGDVSTAQMPALARRVAAARLGLFGRDRGGPNVVFVPQRLGRPFVDALCLHLADSDTPSGLKMPDRRQMQAAMGFAVNRTAYWQNSPVFDYRTQRMGPLVLLGQLPPAPERLSDVDYIDFRAPIFNVLTYQRPADLLPYLTQPDHRRRQMRISLMAPSPALLQALDPDSVLVDETVAEWQASASTPPFHAQVGAATLLRGHMRRRAVCVAKELKTYFTCQRSAAAQARQSFISRALRDTFVGALQRLERELQGDGRCIRGAWYWGDSALHDFLPEAPVRCVVILDAPCPSAGLSAAAAATTAGDLAPGGGLSSSCHELAGLMARQAQLPSISGHSTVIAPWRELLELLAQPPRLLAGAEADVAGRLTLGSKYWRALLLVESLAISAQAFWRPECERLSARLRAQGEAVYAAWTAELQCLAQAVGCGLRAASGEHILTLLQTQPLVLSTVLLP